METLNETWRIYKDIKGEWRWNRKAANGKTIGASTQGYEQREYCLKNARLHGYKGT